MLKKSSVLFSVGVLLLISPLIIHASKQLSIPAAAFHPVTHGEEYRIFNAECTGHYLIKYTDPGNFVAPVYFPLERGRILAMKVLVQDEIKDGCIDIFLMRTHLSTGESEAVFGIVTQTNPGKVIVITDVPIFDRNNFNNQEYAWFVKVGFYDAVQGLRLYNVQLIYE